MNRETTSSSRVFILGAGFSKPAGFPLATELTDEVLDALREIVGDDYGLFEFATHVKQLHGWMKRESELPALNIEEFYEYASVYAERMKMDHHKSPVGRSDGETPYTHADDLMTWMSYLDEHLLEVLLKHEVDANLDPIKRFARFLRPDDTVISFNYDRLLDRCLTSEGVAWSFGIEEQLPPVILILKMHGSINWICLARDQQPAQHGLRRLFSKRDVNRQREVKTGDRSGEFEYDFELYAVDDDDRLRELINARALIQCDHTWGLAGLGPRKRPSLVPGLGLVWDRAQHALSRAQKVVIVGFSFSIFDRLTQVEFARVMAGREEHGVSPPEVIIIDPAFQSASGGMTTSGSQLKKRIEAVFRPIRAIGMSHLDFDWSTL